MAFTIVSEEPYPGETVVSRAPNTWISGQDWRFSTALSMGVAPPKAP